MVDTVAGPSEQRKIVSVLFADLVGFTARSERLDPEDVRALLSPYCARLRSELERFGGTVEKFIRDAVVALFGAPVAHEDDPERAVRAAVAIRDWVLEQPEDLQLRIAVNTASSGAPVPRRCWPSTLVSRLALRCPPPPHISASLRAWPPQRRAPSSAAAPAGPR
jgi:class 3 adenylate cyclase